MNDAVDISEAAPASDAGWSVTWQRRRLLHPRGLDQRLDSPPDSKLRRRRADTAFTEWHSGRASTDSDERGPPLHATVRDRTVIVGAQSYNGNEESISRGSIPW
ncbi:MAG TPA: hypothetical protein DIW46_00780 [Microbacterium sp.]|nr:hypothetical protein [Microbacterium sp.]